MKLIQRKNLTLLLGGILLSSTACNAETYTQAETETIVIESRQMEAKPEVMEDTTREVFNQMDIMEDQSFQVDFDDWGLVYFVTVKPSEGSKDVEFYLMEDSEILYTFPSEFDNDESGWTFEGINFVAFQDIDGDEKLDVLISANYITDTGKQDAAPFSHAKIYNRIPDGFEFNERLSYEIDHADMSGSFAQVTEYIEASDFDLYYSKSEAAAFAEKIQFCLSEDDRQQLSYMVAYPITVNLDGGSLIINDEKEFLDCYDQIFDQEFINRILQYNPEDIGRSYAIFLGNGEIWYSKMEEGYKIYAVNKNTD